MSDTKLRNGLIRLAHTRPDLRDEILPMLHEAESKPKPKYKKGDVVKFTIGGVPMSKGVIVTSMVEEEDDMTMVQYHIAPMNNLKALQTHTTDNELWVNESEVKGKAGRVARVVEAAPTLRGMIDKYNETLGSTMAALMGPGWTVGKAQPGPDEAREIILHRGSDAWVEVSWDGVYKRLTATLSEGVGATRMARVGDMGPRRTAQALVKQLK